MARRGSGALECRRPLLTSVAAISTIAPVRLRSGDQAVTTDALPPPLHSRRQPLRRKASWATYPQPALMQ